MAWTSPRTWISGEIPTAALLNTHVRDNLKAIGDPWASYTPTWTAPTNPSLGNGTILGRYMQAGKSVQGRITLTLGSTTTVGSGSYTFSLPVAATADDVPLARALLFDTSANDRRMALGITVGSGTGVRLRTSNNNTLVDNAAPWVWANGDSITITFDYEAA